MQVLVGHKTLPVFPVNSMCGSHATIVNISLVFPENFYIQCDGMKWYLRSNNLGPLRESSVVQPSWRNCLKNQTSSRYIKDKDIQSKKSSDDHMSSWTSKVKNNCRLMALNLASSGRPCSWHLCWGYGIAENNTSYTYHFLLLHLCRSIPKAFS